MRFSTSTKVNFSWLLSQDMRKSTLAGYFEYLFMLWCEKSQKENIWTYCILFWDNAAQFKLARQSA